MLHADRILQRFGLSLTVATVLASVGCGAQPKAAVDNASDLNQLTDQLIGCVEYNKAQSAQKLDGMPDGFIAVDSWTPQTLGRLNNALAGIPKNYLQYLYQVHDQNGFDISRTQLEGGVIGVTFFTDLPERIQIGNQGFAADFAVQHEVGHAINVKLDGEIANFDGKINTLFKQESQNPRLRSYARSAPAEYFAESFNNFYCGKQSNAFLKAELPKTYDFLKKSLEKPVFESDAGLDPASLSKDVFMALVDAASADAATPVVVSLADGLSRAAICKGDLATCVSTAREDIKFSAATDLKVSGRKLFKSGTGLSITDGQVVTLLGFDAAGALKAAEGYTLHAAGQVAQAQKVN